MKLKCKVCQEIYCEEYDDDNEGTGMCSWCFEGALENYEEWRRQRIAEQNEY